MLKSTQEGFLSTHKFTRKSKTVLILDYKKDVQETEIKVKTATEVQVLYDRFAVTNIYWGWLSSKERGYGDKVLNL